MNPLDLQSMPLGDMLAELVVLTNSFNQLRACIPPKWEELTKVAHDACFVSQGIHTRMPEQRRWEGMKKDPSSKATPLMETFVIASREVTKRADCPPGVRDKLTQYADNISSRVTKIRELMERQRGRDEELGLVAKEAS